MVVVPHLPEYGTVSVHIVDGDFPSCYSYDVSDDTHLNHRIALKDSFGLNGEISIYNERLLGWYGKLKSLQFPVLPIPEFSEIFSDLVKAMSAEESRRYDPSGLDDFLKGVSDKVQVLVTAELRDMPSSGGAISFEGLCERLLKASGYDIEARNQYDSQGGDVDLRCKRSRRDTSIFEGGDVTLFVQIKKHMGVTKDDAVRQVLQMIEREPQADGCVMSMADDFNPEAKRLAGDNGIVLLDRHEICGLLMPLLAERMAER